MFCRMDYAYSFLPIDIIMGLSNRRGAYVPHRHYSRLWYLAWRVFMSKTILGIDVGIHGALAFYDVEELIIFDMPVLGRNKTSRVDGHRLAQILQVQKPDWAMIEQVNAFGMGATSAYNFGWNCGALEGVLSAVGIPFEYVTPQRWKAVMNCPKDKDGARMKASQLLPQFAHNWPLKKHDGRAEATLIALYSYQKQSA